MPQQSAYQMTTALPSVRAADATPTPALRRELGRWDLTAVGINQVIGAAIFLMPSQIAAEVGAWSPIAFVLVGVASLLVALCFAEVASRFDATGGPYLYTRAAFGRFTAFQIGWMYWFMRVTSWASVVNGIALALGYYWPSIVEGFSRAVLITALVAVLAAINVKGIRETAWLVKILTVSKLVPLGIFIVAGLAFVRPERLLPHESVSVTQASTAALLLIFAFGGYDVITVPAGEAGNPRRDVPFALVMTIVAVTIVMGLVQLVVIGILPNSAGSTTPVADATYLFLGSAGALMIGVGSVVSMTGNTAGQLLSGSRMLFAMGERDLPPFFGKVHPAFRTPANAVLVTSGVTLALALTGSFARLAAASGFARLLVYTGASAATLMLRRPRFEGVVNRATFVVPFGPLVPILAIVVSMLILAGSTWGQLAAGGLALAIGAVLYLINAYLSRREASRLA